MGLQESLKDHSNQGPVVLVYNQKILEYELISKTYYLYAMYISTLSLFYKERSDLVTSWRFSDFNGRSLKLFFRF